MQTAQNEYKRLLNDYISPAFRERGFKGSAGRYELPNDDYFVLVGFQKNKWSNQEWVEFTVNLSVTSKRLWAEARAKDGEWMGKAPSFNSEYPNVARWTSRLGG